MYWFTVSYYNVGFGKCASVVVKADSIKDAIRIAGVNSCNVINVYPYEG